MDTNKTIATALFTGFFALVLFSSCVKDDFDTPPIKEIPEGHILTVEQLRDMHQGVSIKFTGDSSVYATVTMDAQSGNIYRNAYVQDHTGAIVLRTLSPGGLYLGDSLRIYLKGAVLSSYNGMLQLDSVDVDYNIIKQKTGVPFSPEIFDDLSAINTGHQAQLIKLENVQFANSELGKTFADPVNLQNVNRMLEDVFGNQIIVRTSGYASFAGDTLPEGSGSMVAIVGEYNGIMQLYIRSKEEIKMNQPRLGIDSYITILEEDFQTTTEFQEVNVNGWQSIAEEGTRRWVGRVHQGDRYAQVSAHGSGEPSNIAWLISPPINIDGYDIVLLNFQTAFEHWVHDALSVFISTDYDGSDPTSAYWQNLTSAVIATNEDGFHNWINSGNVNLSAYSGDIHIGFRYEGSGTGGQTTTYRVNNVKVLGAQQD